MGHEALSQGSRDGPALLAGEFAECRMSDTGYRIQERDMAAPFFENDLDVLNYALTLEHLEAAFYERINASGVLSGNAASYFETIGAHEAAHVAALTDAIAAAGGTPVSAAPSYNFAALGDLETVDGILAAARTLEETGVAAYNGAGREIVDKTILSTAGAIVQTEANHAAIVRALIDPDANPVPSAFPPATAPQAILDAVTPLIGA
jgi:rubrerythrin